MLYLGALISNDSRVESELSRKIGAAKADFNQLQQFWAHSSVSIRSKLQYFNVFIVVKLRYGLATVWLVTAQRRRLDGFVARCVRRILRIPSAFMSRVSNAVVLKWAGLKPFCSTVVEASFCFATGGGVGCARPPLETRHFCGWNAHATDRLLCAQSWTTTARLDVAVAQGRM